MPEKDKPTYSDKELLDWLDEDPVENLEAIEFQLNRGRFNTVRESIAYHLERGL